MDKIVIAVDSFKRCLPASRVAEVIANALRDCLPECKLSILPVSDGGEGLTDILISSMGGLYHSVEAVDPLMRPIQCKIGSFNHCAIIETASAIGLERLNPDECNPMKTTSYGLGMMINAAYDLGYRRMLIGLGGTATVDAGLGALQAMGVRFYNAQGRVLPNGLTGASLIDVEHFDMIATKRKFRDVEFSIACDVTNPIIGAKGAAVVFGPQKGASPEDVQTLDFNLRHVCHVLRHNGFSNFENVQGSGSAGGLGLAFQTFMGCRLASGIDAVLDLIKFNDEIADADLVITGEGRVDSQSLMGKVISGIARRTISSKIGLLVICGRLADREILNRSGIKEILAISPDSMPDEEAILPDVAMKNIYDGITEWVANRKPDKA
ncbi:MAG: glycerate kinase [Paludibacteraceae bacterium]|nr:glycerate kinase [Paludibacteraceae bacterium]